MNSQCLSQSESSNFSQCVITRVILIQKWEAFLGHSVGTSEMRSQAKTKNDRLLEYNIVSHNGKESKKAVLYTRLSENRHGMLLTLCEGKVTAA